MVRDSVTCTKSHPGTRDMRKTLGYVWKLGWMNSYGPTVVGLLYSAVVCNTEVLHSRNVDFQKKKKKEMLIFFLALNLGFTEWFKPRNIPITKSSTKETNVIY